MPKKILIVSRSFYPMNSPRSFRTTELARELARQGHEVTVVIPKTDFDYCTFEKDFKLKVLDDIVLKKADKSPFSTKRGLFTRIKDRFLHQAFLYPEVEITTKIQKFLKSQMQQYDLLISIAKPYTVHLGCALALKKNRNLAKYWVADCGDPFNPSSNPYFFPFYIKWFVNWMFKQADFITIPVNSAKSAYPKEAQKKIVIIPQGFNFSNIELTPQPIKNKVPTFAYAGALYNKIRSPEKLLTFLAGQKIDFKFVFYTNNTEFVEPFFSVLNQKIEIRKPLPRAELLTELSKMDFLVNIENTTKEMAPSKFIDYALTKRPILNLHPENFDPGLVLEFLKGNYRNRLFIRDLEKYNIKNVAAQFLNLSD